MLVTKIIKMTGIIAKHTDLLQKYIQFAVNYGVEEFDSLFDFIPVEVLERIINYVVTDYNTYRECNNLTLVCKRFDEIYISIIDRKTLHCSLRSEILHPVINWREKIDSFGVLTNRELSMILFKHREYIFQCNKFFTIDCRKTKRCVFYIGNESHYVEDYSKVKTYQVDEEIELITNDIGGLFTEE